MQILVCWINARFIAISSKQFVKVVLWWGKLQDNNICICPYSHYAFTLYLILAYIMNILYQYIKSVAKPLKTLQDFRNEVTYTDCLKKAMVSKFQLSGFALNGACALITSNMVLIYSQLRHYVGDSI